MDIHRQYLILQFDDVLLVIISDKDDECDEFVKPSLFIEISLLQTPYCSILLPPNV